MKKNAAPLIIREAPGCLLCFVCIAVFYFLFALLADSTTANPHHPDAASQESR